MATTRDYIYKVSTKGTEKAERSVNKLTGRFDGLAKKVGAAAAAYFGARGLINAFQQAIQLAGEQEQAERQLETALGHTSTALLKQASALQQVLSDCNYQKRLTARGHKIAQRYTWNAAFEGYRSVFNEVLGAI